MPHSFIRHQLPAMYEREAIQVVIESNQVIQWPKQASIDSCQCVTGIGSKIAYDVILHKLWSCLPYISEQT